MRGIAIAHPADTVGRPAEPLTLVQQPELNLAPAVARTWRPTGSKFSHWTAWPTITIT